MRFSGLLALVLLGFFVITGTVMGQNLREIPRSQAKPTPMPAERAKAVFEDKSVKTFMSMTARDFGGKCRFPDYARTEASTTQAGSGDFSSTFYEIVIPCPGVDGLSAVVITAEFSPPLGTPLDLALTLRYRR